MKKLFDVHLIVGLLAIVIAAMSWRLWAQACSERKDHIELHDSDGRVRVRMLATDAGGRIELVDEAGRVRLSLRQDSEGAALEMTREDGSKGIEMTVRDGAGSATVSVYSSTGGDAATLGAGERAWLTLRSGKNELAVSNGPDRSEIAITHGTQAVRYQLDNGKSRFVSDVPVSVSLWPFEQLGPGMWSLGASNPDEH